MNNQVKGIVEKIWKAYDTDQSGVLEGAEADKFIADLFKEMGSNIDQKGKDAIRKYLDKDGSHTISKEELASLLTEIL